MIKNKKQYKKTNKLQYIFFSFLFILIIAVDTFKILELTQKKQPNPDRTPEISQESTNTPPAKNPKTSDQNHPDPVAPESKTPIQNDPVQPDNSSGQPAITGYINRLEKTSNNLMILLTINQFLNTPGNCYLTISNGAKSLSYQAPTITNPSSSSCEGFTLPLSDFSSGEWSIDIKVTSGEKSGHITGKVTI